MAQEFLFANDVTKIKLFREVLLRGNYTDQGVVATLGVENISSIQAKDIPQLLRLTESGSPLETLIRLFLMEVGCDLEAVESAVNPLPVEDLLSAGLIEIKGDKIAAALKLQPYRNLVLAFDLSRMLQSEMASQYVMGIGRSTMTLENMAIKKAGGSVLDLGTGCGTLALLAAPQSDHVVATDRNPRAIAFAAFNARLNELANVELREGDFFAPVASRKFDLVLSNPPFVISPENRFIYRDGGMSADQIIQKIILEVPRYLNNGGYCQMLCNWAENNAEDWKERLAKWFGGSGCDVLVLRSVNHDAATYASTWIKHTEKDSPQEFLNRLNKWLAYYKEQDIQSVSSGVIIMRKADGKPNWFAADESPENMLGPCGDNVVRLFSLQDFLHSVQGDADLLAASLRLSPDIRLERVSKPGPKGWEDETIKIYLAKGLAYAGNIDHLISRMLLGCNGKKPLRILLNEMAAAVGMDADRIAPDLCRIVRGLIGRGFLLPAEEPAGYVENG